MTVGAVVSAGVIIVAGMVLRPKHIQVDSINQAAAMLTDAFPLWGFALFAVSVGIACIGASTEVGLSLAYAVSQTFGWQWGEGLEPAKNARFALTYTVAILLASVVIALGVDPLKLTIYTMALNATVLPVVAIPFLLLMNDGQILGKHTNGVIANAATIAIIVISVVLFVVSIPLVFLGG